MAGVSADAVCGGIGNIVRAAVAGARVTGACCNVVANRFVVVRGIRGRSIVSVASISHNALAETGNSAELFYLDSGASNHVIPSRDNLHAYQKFAKPVETSAADGKKIYAYGSGTLRVATSANSLGREVGIQDVYYAPEVHARLVSLGRLEGQGWDVME